MKTRCQEMIDRLQDLNPDEIRSRLIEIEAEEKGLRVLLRTARAARAMPVKPKKPE
jgi:hypothetical protein